jgi:hypothetical protein
MVFLAGGGVVDRLLGGARCSKGCLAGGGVVGRLLGGARCSEGCLASGGVVGRWLGGARCSTGLVAVGNRRVDLFGSPVSELIAWSKEDGRALKLCRRPFGREIGACFIGGSL